MKNLIKKGMLCIAALALLGSILTMPASAASTSVLDGKITLSDTVGNISADGTTVTATATGTKSGRFGTNGSTQTNTITLTNNTTDTATICFTWEAKRSYNYGGSISCTVDGEAATSGTFEKNIGAGSSITITLSATGAAYSDQKATLTLSNFNYTAIANNYNVTMDIVGSGTVTAAGKSVSDGSVITVSAISGVALVATPSSGNTFVAWVNGTTNEILSTSTPYTINPTAAMTVQAVFVNTTSDTAWFGVGKTGAVSNKDDAYLGLDTDGFLGDSDDSYPCYDVSVTHIYSSLEGAIAVTSKDGNNVIVSLNNGYVPAGDYTIPEGVTLLIPFDDAYTMYTTAPGFIYSENREIASNYRSLTLKSGANISVKGAISLSTVAHSADGGETAGKPVGDYSKLIMEEGSTVTIENGGALYAWGFVTAGASGAGEITAKSGATVYENFQITDYRGGRQSSGMENSVFATSQYYVQNVEVPMTLEAGAKEYCCTWVNLITGTYADTLSTIPFIASNGLFNLTSGSLTKTYDGATDRLIVEFNGTASINSVTLSIGANLAQALDITSASSVLGINNNITINVSGGEITLNQSVGFQPGSVLIIADSAKVVLGSGISAYVYDGDQWGNFCAVAGSKFVSVPFAPGRKYTRTEADLVDAEVVVNGTLDISAGCLYTTEGGANIRSTANGKIIMPACTDSTTAQYNQSTDTYTTYLVTSAQLHNGDGTYDENGNYNHNGTYLPTGTAGTYNYRADHKRWVHGEHTITDTVTAPTCTEAGYTTHTCTCEYTYVGGEVSALGHSCNDATFDTAMTCTVCSEIQNSACIGETPYSTLKEAVEAAAGTENAVILMANFSDEVITISQNVTINKGDYTANIVPGDGFAMTGTDDTVTIYELTVKIAGTSVTAADSLAIYFYVDVSPDEGDYYAVITRTKLEKDTLGVYSNKQTVTKTIDSKDWVVSGGYLRFCYEGIAAKEMTDPVSVTIYDASGKQVSATITESIESYALRSLEKHTDTKLHTALVDMLNYGAAAQTHFGYKTEDLANAELTTEQAALATKDEDISYSNITEYSGYTLEGATVTAESNLYFTFYFKGITNSSNFTAEISYTDHRGEPHTQTISGSDFLSYGSYYGPRVTGIAVADGATAITCTLKEGDTVVATATSSVVSYAVATIEQNKSNPEKADLVALCNMLMKFVNSAYAYFHQNDSVA